MREEEDDITLPATLGIAEAAALLRLGQEALRSLIASGALPALSLNRKHWVLLKTDVLDYIAKQGRMQQEHRIRCNQAMAAVPRRRGRRSKPLPPVD